MKLISQFEWEDIQIPAGFVARVGELPQPLQKLLASRGVSTEEEIKRFTTPTIATLTDPFEIPGMRAAVERTWHAIDHNERIVVFGDFDADGIVATAMLADALEALGASVHAFLPHRINEGYGVTPAALARCLAECPGARLIITVDCGIGAREVLRGLPQGVDVIVTDHHHLPGSTGASSSSGSSGASPSICAVVHPGLPGAPAASRKLCGAGVAFKLVHALVKQGRVENRERALALDPRRWLDAVAVATIADVVPLVDENRALAGAGLRRLAQAPSVGLAALLESAGMMRTAQGFSARDVAFKIAPRINASGRLDTARDALELLRARDPAVARSLAKALHEFNEDRRTLEQGQLLEILAQLRAEPPQPGATVVASADWHPGLAGLLAARLSEHFQQPAAVITIPSPGRARGSLRADARYDLMAALTAVSSCLEGFGGHARAAGIALAPGNISEFRERFAEACRAQAGDAPARQRLRIDAWLEPRDITDALLNATRLLEPFGEANEAPRWAMSGLVLREPPRVMGADGAHLALAFSCGNRAIRGVWFRAGHLVEKIRSAGNSFDAAFELVHNTFLDQTSLEFRIADMRSNGGTK